MSTLLLLALTGPANAFFNGNAGGPDQDVKCEFIDGELVCNEIPNGPGGDPSDGILEIRTSDAEADSTQPTAIYIMFEGTSDWVIYTQVMIDGDTIVFAPAVEHVPDVTSHSIDTDVNGDGLNDLTVEDGGDVLVWYGGITELQDFGAPDEIN